MDFFIWVYPKQVTGPKYLEKNVSSILTISSPSLLITPEFENHYSDIWRDPEIVQKSSGETQILLVMTFVRFGGS